MRTKTSYSEDKEELLARLRRMEGQVRGIEKMVNDDRYYVDVVQQLTALTAAARAVELLVISDHLRGCVIEAASSEDCEATISEMVTVLRKALK